MKTKKIYRKPSMKVQEMRNIVGLLAGSGCNAISLNATGFGWDDDGIEDTEYDR